MTRAGDDAVGAGGTPTLAGDEAMGGESGANDGRRRLGC